MSILRFGSARLDSAIICEGRRLCSGTSNRPPECFYGRAFSVCERLRCYDALRSGAGWHRQFNGRVTCFGDPPVAGVDLEHLQGIALAQWNRIGSPLREDVEVITAWVQADLQGVADLLEF